VATADCRSILLPPTLPRTAPLLFKIENLEQINPANNLSVPGYAPATGVQGAWGLFRVSVIEFGVVLAPGTAIGSNGMVFFTDGGPSSSSRQITGIFYGLQSTSATTWTGGTVDFFWHNRNQTYIDASCLSGATCAPDAATVGLFTAGALLVRLKLASGIDPASAQTFTMSDVPLNALETRCRRVCKRRHQDGGRPVDDCSRRRFFHHNRRNARYAPEVRRDQPAHVVEHVFVRRAAKPRPDRRLHADGR
jgi:hypothetical protein